jgi:hydrogenase expression/formation protein HypC
MCLGVPGRITAVEDGLVRMGTVDFDGSSLEVCLAYVPEALPGDYVLVHAGFALSQLDEDQAAKTLEALRELGDAPEPAPPSHD